MVDNPSFLNRTKMSLRPDTIVFSAEYVEEVAAKYGKQNPMINWMLARGNALEDEGPLVPGTGKYYSLKKMGLAVGEYEAGQQDRSPMEHINEITALIQELLEGKGYYPSIPAAYFDFMRLHGSKNRIERASR